MSSALSSTTCYIKSEPYYLRIYTDANSNPATDSNIDDILLSVDDADLLNTIRLHFELVSNEKKNSNQNDDNTIPETILFNKLLNVKLAVKSSNESNSSEETSETSSTEFTQVNISYIDISESFVWTVKRLELEMDSKSAQQLCSISNRYLSKLKHRPRHLLVFVNPECGKNAGSSVYEEQVLPLFEEANINVKTIHTERPNHAQDYISEQSLDDYDGLISVGGDGMFSELSHSLLLKTVKKAGLNIDDPNIPLKPPKLRIGVIPAGSTDAVAFGTTGHNDPITSALQIIVGESLLIDVATVHSERGFVCFMVTMFAYGFFGNVIQQSEQWRFFGPLRYILSGAFQVIRNTSYATELTITRASENDDTKGLSEDDDRDRYDVSIKKRRDMPNERSDVNKSVDSGKVSSSRQINRKGHYRTINCLNMPCRCDNSKYGMSPSVHLADGSFDVVLVKHSWRLAFLRFLHYVAHYGQAIEDLWNVERFRATKVVIHPIITQQKELGNWACDGELIKANEITIYARQQALNLFASGIHHDQIKKINEEEESKIIPKPLKEGFYSFSNILTSHLGGFIFLFLSLCFFFLYSRFFSS